MSKEIWIVIVVILILLSPFIASKLNGSQEQLLGWADTLLPKSVATSTAPQSGTSETDLWLRNSTGVSAPRLKPTHGV